MLTRRDEWTEKSNIRARKMITRRTEKNVVKTILRTERSFQLTGIFKTIFKITRII